MLIYTDIPVLQNYKLWMFAEEPMGLHQLSGDVEIIFLVHSTRLFVPEQTPGNTHY